MKKITNYLLMIFGVVMLVFIALSLVSCGSRKQEAVILTQTKEIKEVIRDTIFKVEADSSWYKAYIDCSEGKPKLINPQSQSGKHLPPPLVDIDSKGMLSVRAETKAQELFKQWREQHITESVPKPIYVDKIVYKDTPFTWYHKALMGIGILTIILLIIGIIAKIKK